MTSNVAFVSNLSKTRRAQMKRHGGCCPSWVHVDTIFAMVVLLSCRIMGLVRLTVRFDARSACKQTNLFLEIPLIADGFLLQRAQPPAAVGN